MSHRSLVLLVAAVTLAGCGRANVAGNLVTQRVTAQGKQSGKITAPSAAARPSVSLTPTAAQTAALAPVEGEYIVKFRESARDLPGATRLRDLSVKGTAVYKLNANGYALQAAEGWDEADDIDYIEPNYQYQTLEAPNDPAFGDSWGVAAILAPSIWPTTTGSGIKVAVIDTGVDATHPDLRGQVLPGLDLVNDDEDAADDHGHGTHVAGTIAALANNGIGVAGVAPGAAIIPIKALNSKGQGSNADIANGIVAAADRGAQVINLSLGGTDNSETLRRAVAQVQERGVIVVAAAGNSGISTPFFPAANEGVIGVGAVDDHRKRATFSNFGDYIDVAAPGVNIGSTQRGGGTTTMSGTSMASPHVAAACALLKAKFPMLKAGHLSRLFKTTGFTTTGFTGSNAPRALNLEDAFTKAPNLDMQPPAAVTGLAGVAGPPEEVDLSWNAAADNASSVTYRILRDGVSVGTSTGTQFTDRGVTRQSNYQVISMDADGNEASPSAAVAASPGQASDLIKDLAVSSRGQTEVTLSWKTKEPMRCLVQWGETSSLGQASSWDISPKQSHTFKLTGLKRFQTYHYRVVAATNASQLHYTKTQRVRTKLWWLFALPSS
ncbi:MAG: S8 family serine peptidase [Candidatus Sericytochromatia bacterium]|nr:S8 family serine peptidase [Candidatus Sericytochromatia bacterium]